MFYNSRSSGLDLAEHERARALLQGAADNQRVHAPQKIFRVFECALVVFRKWNVIPLAKVGIEEVQRNM